MTLPDLRLQPPTQPEKPPAKAAAPLPYPRRCDTIATKAQGTFVYSVGVGFAAFLLWSGMTDIDKVTRGQGRVVPQQQNQLIQHLEGGIVTEILVKEGDKVVKGQPLLRVENSFWQSELAQARIDLKAKRVKMVRLEAEISGNPLEEFPEDLSKALPQIIQREREVYHGRTNTLNQQILILKDQVRQRQIELSEYRSRQDNMANERDLIHQRVQSLRKLVTVGAVSRNELLDAERILQQTDSKISDLAHEIPKTEAAISEISRRMTDATLRFRGEAEKDRSDTEIAMAKLNESIGALTDRSQRAEVAAPINGIVNKLHITTIGGVVRSGEPLVQLVPIDSSIAVEARLSPSDRAEVWPGLPAVVKITAYEYSVYGGIKGKVIEISSDALQDEKGQTYFRVRLEADAASFGPSRPIVPGMTADVDILTGQRTVLQYLIRPVRKLMDNALRQ